jgi:2-oxoglutarate dehydrogenase E2 component (dihydrolipoamide succinyltransferase)
MDVIMPRMGETVDEGTVNEWFKEVGDQVAEGEPLLEIGTDKVDTEVPAPVSGTLTEIRVQEGETVPVATVLAVIQ